MKRRPLWPERVNNVANCFDVIAYAEDGALYCEDCFEGDADGEDVSPVFGDTEFDCPQCCSACGSDLEVQLTSDGITYVKERILKAWQAGNAEEASDLGATYPDAWDEALEDLRPTIKWTVETDSDGEGSAFVAVANAAAAEVIKADLHSLGGATVETPDGNACYAKFPASQIDEVKADLLYCGYVVN